MYDAATFVRIRDARPSDAPTLLALVHAAYEQYRDKLDPPSDAHKETIASTELALRTARAFIAEVDDETAGAVFYEPSLDHVALFRLSVAPAYRRRGVGSALVDAVERFTETEGAGRVLLAVRIAVPENVRFYERRGYRVREAGSYQPRPIPTHFVMEKIVAAKAPERSA
jgi:ribosomal protein S18 acetylase RimI-like enzyme